VDPVNLIKSRVFEISSTLVRCYVPTLTQIFVVLMASGGTAGGACRLLARGRWMHGPAVAVAVMCALLAAPVSSRTALGQTNVQIDNAASTSKPDDSQTPEANPARPTIASPAHIPPVGYLQFEQGFLQANGSPNLDGQFSVNWVIKLAVQPRLMFQFLTQPFAASVAGEDNSSAAGDLQAGAQIILLKEAGRSPSVAVGYVRRLHGGDAIDLDIGSFSQSALVLLSGDLNKFHYDSNFVVSEQNSGAVRRAQFGETISVTHDLWIPELELTGELWHFSQPFVTQTYTGEMHPRSNAAGMLWTVGYSVRPNFVLDAGFDHGLTVTSTQWQGFAGFTYLLPYRLWKHREPTVSSKPTHHRHRR
jgi:hypothetical protein